MTELARVPQWEDFDLQEEPPKPGEDTIGHEVPVTVMVGGEYKTFLHPGNFPWVLNAHLASIEEIKGNIIAEAYKGFLTNDPAGRAVGEALDQAMAHPETCDLMIKVLYEPADTTTKDYHYAQLVDLIAHRFFAARAGCPCSPRRPGLWTGRPLPARCLNTPLSSSRHLIVVRASL